MSRVMKIDYLRVQQDPFALKRFFWYKPLLLLSSTYQPFHCAKFKEILTADPEL